MRRDATQHKERHQNMLKIHSRETFRQARCHSCAYVCNTLLCVGERECFLGEGDTYLSGCSIHRYDVGHDFGIFKLSTSELRVENFHMNSCAFHGILFLTYSTAMSSTMSHASSNYFKLFWTLIKMLKLRLFKLLSDNQVLHARGSIFAEKGIKQFINLNVRKGKCNSFEFRWWKNDENSGKKLLAFIASSETNNGYFSI